MRSVLLGVMLASVAGFAVAQDWGNMATISSTLGNNTNRLCIGDHSRPGDIGCPTWAPSVTTAGNLIVSGSVSANSFVGDGSGLTNVGAASTDRITSGTTKVTANSTGYVSFTTGGVTTGYMDNSGLFIVPGVSSTGQIAGTTGYFTSTLTTLNAITANNGNITAATGNVITGSNFSYSGGTGYLAWSGSTNNSIQGDATNRFIAIRTSGTEAMRIVSSGYVGIGTSTPTKPLDVTGAVAASGVMSTGTYFSGPAIYGGSAANGLLTLAGTTNATPGNVQINTSGGKVSVGTGNPSSTLHISGSALITSWTGINFAGQNVTPTAPLEVSGTISATHFVGDGSGLTGIASAATTDRITSGTTSMLAISGTGYVSLTQSGVNTGWFDPSRGLVTIGVSSTGPISGTNGYFSGLVGIGRTPGNGYSVDAAQAIRTGNVLQTASGSSTTPAHTFTNDNSTGMFMPALQTLAFAASGTEALRIVSSGNVGIGSSAPSTKLDVNGSVSIRGEIDQGMVWNGSNWVYTLTGSPAFVVRNNGNGLSQFRFAPPGSAGSIAPTKDAMLVNGATGYVGMGVVATPSTQLEVSGTISATNLVVNGVSITGSGATADRIVSGSINAIADVSSGAVRVSGTLALSNTGNEPCDAAHYYTFRANPVTQQLEMCRP
ncbi:hypothetical protein [Bradyrhizobium sp. CCGUVB23]|uniref:beta strand repeat-containing protein n=1 Tax=Bradyrhizobium sp. CCGUVB23 TaxID=2949630 RepID=UPI0020B328F9|nr:hypothetical protein [Bradyrhizobium sp. CCGUVB23]MCP3463049.1 hypothetical protein [Bradyrhizobium sp. CCGUVB23]